MQKIGILVISTTIITILITGTLFVLSRIHGEQINSEDNTDDNSNRKNNDNGLIINKPINQLTQGAWIPNWGVRSGYESLRRNKEKFDNISPVLYTPNKDGTLKNLEQSGHKELLDFLRNNNITIIPSINLTDTSAADTLSQILNNNVSLQTHIDSIVAEVVNKNFDGIDIDYESIYLDDKNKFLDFLKNLAEVLDTKDKFLSVTVLAKWGDDIQYTFAPQTHAVEDYREISEIVDELRIMAYDYTFRNSSIPGPLAPISWVEEIARYAVKNADRNKVILAARLYAYDWQYDPANFVKMLPIDEYKPTDNPTTKAYTYEEVLQIKQKFTGQDEYDTDIDENIFKYKDGENYRIIFYPDTRSINAHKNIAAKYGLKGVMYWRLGGDNGIDF